MAKRPLVSATIWRVGGLLVCELLGLLARVPLARTLGAEGMGLFQRVNSLSHLILLTAGGFQTAIALMVASHTNKPHWIGDLIFHAWRLLFRLGLGLAVLLFGLAPVIATLFGDARLTLLLRTLSPALLLAPAIMLYRGYYMGMRNMAVVALSDVGEHLVRAICMVGLATWLMPRLGVEEAAAGSVFGASLGACFALVFLHATRPGRAWASKTVQHSGRQASRAYEALVHKASALTVAAAVWPLADVLAALIVPVRLQNAGFTLSEATSLYGQVAGMALSVVIVPMILNTAFASVIGPTVAAAWAEQDHRAIRLLAQKAIGYVAAYGLICGLVLLWYGPLIGEHVFAKPYVGIALRWLSPLILVAGLRDVTSAVLFGTDCHQLAVRHLGVGLGLAIPITLLLGETAAYAIISTVSLYLVPDTVACALNLVALNAHIIRSKT